MIKKQSVTNLTCFIIKMYASVVFGKVIFFKKGRGQPFVHHSIVFCLNTALQNLNSK